MNIPSLLQPCFQRRAHGSWLFLSPRRGALLAGPWRSQLLNTFERFSPWWWFQDYIPISCFNGSMIIKSFRCVLLWSSTTKIIRSPVVHAHFWLVVEPIPLKNWETLVNWDDDIPIWKNKKKVPKHQADFICLIIFACGQRTSVPQLEDLNKES